MLENRSVLHKKYRRTEVLLYGFFPIVFHLSILSHLFSLLLCHEEKSYCNAVLIVFSLLFYACGDLSFLWLVVASALVNFVLGRGIERFRDKNAGKAAPGAWLVLNLGTLVGFKYTGFFIENLNHWFSLSIPVPDLRCRLASAFSRSARFLISSTAPGASSSRNGTFHIPAVRFVFPITISGPIARYETMQAYLHQRRISADDISIGFGRIAWDLPKRSCWQTGFPAS